MQHPCFERAGITASGFLLIALVMASFVICAGRVYAVEPAPALPATTHTVVRGETLDRIIHKTMSDSPLKIQILRKAFVNLNPQAFVSGNVARLQAGAVLQVPDHQQLLRTFILPALGSADIPVSAENKPVNAGERRSWVRFP